MDKASTTQEDPADLGLLVPGTDGHARVGEILEKLQRAEEADPERRRRRLKQDAALNAIYRRKLGRDLGESQRLEELIRDARSYVEADPSGAHTARGRKAITKTIWDAFLPAHPSMQGRTHISGFGFEALHEALWAGDSPLAEVPERSGARPEGRRGRPQLDAIDGQEVIKLRDDYSQVQFARIVKISVDVIQRAEAGTASEQTIIKLCRYAKKHLIPLTPDTLKKPTAENR